ncbi:hypothetical protein COE08_00895 [Priestia megaterium]|uniref:hypothetical protein n=1 Tax=Priestia megaterium TaxID=1404 RepID=UPI000BED05CE|nr:hypothetical protein [Priestia megaterium]PED63436.1 hypothetical protein CON20_26775 [Priestia megaterium]PGX23267.1 hypothetical protein COE08_00895 [Priestia megaterium]
MEGLTAGVMLGTGATLIGTIITSTINVSIAKGQYKRDVNKAYLQKKVEAYTNVCRTIVSIKNVNDGGLVLSHTPVGLKWVENSIKELSDVCIAEGLWLDNEDIETLENLTEEFVTFLFTDDEKLDSRELIAKCHDIFVYCSEKNRKLHLMDNKKPWWKLR